MGDENRGTRLASHGGTGCCVITPATVPLRATCMYPRPRPTMPRDTWDDPRGCRAAGGGRAGTPSQSPVARSPSPSSSRPWSALPSLLGRLSPARRDLSITRSLLSKDKSLGREHRWTVRTPPWGGGARRRCGGPGTLRRQPREWKGKMAPAGSLAQLCVQGWQAQSEPPLLPQQYAFPAATHLESAPAPAPSLSGPDERTLTGARRSASAGRGWLPGRCR